MKKIILTVAATSLLALSGASADGTIKSGFKLGGGLGYKHHAVKHEMELTASPGFTADKASKTDSKNTANFQGHFGYDWIINQFLVGIESQYRYAPGKVKTREIFSQFDVAANPGPNHELTQTHKHDFALAANLGGLVTKSIALYAIASVRLGHFKHSSQNFKPGLMFTGTVGYGPTTTKSKWLWGAGFGVGAKWMVCDCLSIGFETTYDMYQTLKTGDQFTGPSDVHSTAKKPRIFNAMLITSWHF